MNKILVVDDQQNVREALRQLLKDDYEVIDAGDGRGALLRLEEEPGLVILDVKLPDLDGLEVLRQARRLGYRQPVIMLSGVNQVRTVVEAMKLGAVDYLAKPFDSEELKLAVQRMFEYRDLNQEVAWLQAITGDYRRPQLVGRSAALEKIRGQVACYAGPAGSVLITGESGVGKEVVAKMIHFQGARKDKPFIPVHCAAVPENLFESELFGYEKGAFTDASARKEGMFDLAGEGTIFLDEVGEMPLVTQAKLLRVLQEKEYIRLGGNRFLKTGARVLAATARDLERESAAGRFRRDLFYRLNVLNLHIPPLRERRDDVPDLARHFFLLFRRELRVRTEGIRPEAMDWLVAYDWPGNVRELKNAIERLLVLYGHEKEIGPGHLSSALSDLSPGEQSPPARPGVPLETAVQEYERRLIRQALREAGGIKSEAARLLGTTRRIIAYRMEKLGISDAGAS